MYERYTSVYRFLLCTKCNERYENTNNQQCELKAVVKNRTLTRIGVETSNVC